jgi:hypothetical protein
MWYALFMAKSISGTRKKRGRGRPPTGGTSIHLRVLPDQLKKVDEWRDAQFIEHSRPEAIRELVDLGLSYGSPPKGGKQTKNK